MKFRPLHQINFRIMILLIKIILKKGLMIQFRNVIWTHVMRGIL
jgi:hypothetical protein